MHVVRTGNARDSQEVERQMKGSSATQLSLLTLPPCFFVSVDSNGDKVVCFHTLLRVLILRRVSEGFSISADSKALAEMERAVSPLLTSPKGQCAVLYTHLIIILYYLYLSRGKVRS